VARSRKQLDLRAAAAALTAPGAENATMESIARRLEVAKPTLYRMAGSREELIEICVDAESERLLEQIHRGFGPSDSAPAERLAEGLQAFFRFVDDSPAGFLLLFGGRYPEARPAVRRVENRLQEILRREAPGAGEELPHAEVLAAGLLALAAGIARRAIEDGVPWDSAELPKIVGRAVAEGF